MKIEANKAGCTLIREPGDKRISHESTVTHHIRRLLNERDGRQVDDHKAGTWRRFYPNKVGLTACRQGVWNGRKGASQVAYWHERYAIENAAEEFNKSGKVWYMRAAD
jgi:hypothetical protein